MTADEVLKGCQALYETHKLTTYPRTDSGHLPESQHSDAANVLSAVKQVNPELTELIDQCDPSFKSKTWNDKKVTAHHGIIPTMHRGGKHRLTQNERRLYELIVRAYLAQFYPYHEYLSTSVHVDIENERFIAYGQLVKTTGWKAVYQESTEQYGTHQNTNQKIPLMKKNDSVVCEEVKNRT